MSEKSMKGDEEYQPKKFKKRTLRTRKSSEVTKKYDEISTTGEDSEYLESHT